MGRAQSAEVMASELDELVADLKAFGAPPETVAAAIAQIRPAVRDAVFRVHPANVSAVRLFQAMRTQWNVVSVASLDQVRLIHLGLRYEVLGEVSRALGLERSPADFERLQLMEAEAIAAFAERNR